MQYQFVTCLSRLVCRLPGGLRERLGNLIGQLCWPFVPDRRRKIAVDNAMMALGLDRMAAEDIVKRSAVRFGRMFMEVLRLPQLSKDNIRQWVTLQGQEHLAAALDQGRGVVLITAHSGNWEMLGAALAMYGFPLVAVVQQQTNQAMDRFINEYRTLAGMHVTYKTGVREMVSLLGENKIIGLLMDQDARSKGVFTEFFGRIASTPQGPAALARLKNAPIVPAFITENPDGTHTALIHPAMEMVKTANRDEDIRAMTELLNRVVEEHIRAHPHEWFWLHNRWKTPPPCTDGKKQ
ncbi:MAG TPA: lysophospholipid acyltransferase family protein [Selenomonadales bacterium]|nr:lysophospholipid acyltransferase family protein [Selenomonadales bacterium]